MSSETTVQRISFRHKFRLPGMDQYQAPGSFDLVIEKVPLDVSWDAHRTSCSFIVVSGGTTSAYPVSMADIEEALRSDEQHDDDTGHS